MRWAVHEGILTGVGENKLAPQGAVTRQQLAVILYRAAGSPEAGGATLSEFNDGAQVADWAAGGMAWAVRSGIVTGRGGGMLDPAGTASRAEVAAMLMRIA
ncbi:MAG: S-layer homology domain-containing protein [Clostridia bacterium]|nr:S-layer homology domain-containing protein [Clostridia bacterium]